MPGGGGGGPTTTMQNSNSTSNQGPPQQIQGKLGDILGDFWGWYQNNKTAPDFYSGPLSAPMSTATKEGFDALDMRGRIGSPVISAADEAIIRQLDPAALDLGNNPYFGGAVNAYLEPLTENFNKKVLPGLRSQFESAGRTGSGADFDVAMRAANDFNRTTANATASMANEAYQQALNRQLSAAGLAPTLADQDYKDIMARLQAGQGRESYEQKAIDEAIARDTYGKTAQGDWAARVAQILQTIWPGGQTQSSGTSYGTGAAGGGGGEGAQLAGAGIGLAGALGSAAIIA